MQDDRGSLARGKLAQCFDDHVDELRIFVELRRRPKFYEPRLGRPPTALAAKLIYGPIHDDPFQPRSERPFRIEAVERTKRPDDRFLRSLVGEHPVADDG